MDADQKTLKILEKIAEEYTLPKLLGILKDEDTQLVKKDIYISLRDIVKAVESEEDTLKALQQAKNLYGAPIFAVNAAEGVFLIKNEPDFEKAIIDFKKYSFCFKLSPYHIVNTYLAIIESQITGFEIDKLLSIAGEHIEDSIKQSLKNNPNWNFEAITNARPSLIMPIGAAGCGKSTFYRELSNVVNFSCDNIRYLLFKDFGPCFSSWESCLSWWVVNYLTDSYLSRGYSVFYNGVNTDMEYRSPITMEDKDKLFEGMPYDVKLVYFEPAVHLNDEELKELKDINLWASPIDAVDMTRLSQNTGKIIEMIKNNYQRTLLRTKEITDGIREQDPFDILYAVPAPVIKLFVEQSFDRPEGENVIIIPKKEIVDPEERSAYYKSYAKEVLQV